MSYILDALNKSEQERSNQRLPGLGTIHRHGPAGEHRNLNPWMVAVILLVIVNMAGLGYWYVAGDAQQPVEVAASSSVPKVPPATNEQLAQTPSPQAQARITGPATPRAEPEPVRQTPTVSPAREVLITPQDYARNLAAQEAARAPAPMTIEDLPLDIQRQIPDLVFSSHIYAEDASFRMVNINGRSIREGERVAEGILLETITEDGVVLGYLNYKFEVSVLRDWSFR